MVKKMTKQVGINGFGRIGKLFLRAAIERDADIEFVGINDLTDTRTLGILLKYDSTFGPAPFDVKWDESTLIVKGKSIPVTAIKEPEKLPWAERGAQIVVECTGIFTKKADASKHIEAGAEKVLISAPSDDKDPADLTVVMGVNDDKIEPDMTVLSNGSCTTNSLAPPMKVLYEKFGVDKAFMTTIHSFTNDQRVIDFIHRDLRRARTASTNIIPTTTGAARAMGLVFPDLKGKIDGLAVRVPTPDGSLTDLTAILQTETDKKEINAALKEASETTLEGIMRYTEDPIVTHDIIGDPHSAIIDGDMTMVIGGTGNLIKVLSWYDNEWGFSCRMVELVTKKM